MDFRPVLQDHISSVALRRNNILRKLLDYGTSIECFMGHIDEHIDKKIVSLKWTNQYYRNGDLDYKRFEEN